jgi:ribosomal protein L33
MFTKHEDHKPKWTTKDIQISCKNERNLYITHRNMNNPKDKNYYEKYCAVMKRVIKEAKRLHCNNLIKEYANQIIAM